MPAFAMTTAPMPGPTTRARLNPLELSAMAPASSLRSTSSMTSACRAGISKALMRPFAAASAISHPIVMWPDVVNHQSAPASSARSVWQIRTAFSRSTRSATTPPCRENRRTGRLAADATSPTRKELFDSSRASQPVAMACIHVPISDTVWPTQNSRKLRCRSVRNGFAITRADNLDDRGYVLVVRFHTYSKFSPELADAVDLQALLDKLADFLLQSGFAGGNDPHSYYDSGLE